MAPPPRCRTHCATLHSTSANRECSVQCQPVPRASVTGAGNRTNTSESQQGTTTQPYCLFGCAQDAERLKGNNNAPIRNNGKLHTDSGASSDNPTNRVPAGLPRLRPEAPCTRTRPALLPHAVTCGIGLQTTTGRVEQMRSQRQHVQASQRQRVNADLKETGFLQLP